jgi:hypothetical protein
MKPEMEHFFEVQGTFTVSGYKPVQVGSGYIHELKRNKKTVRLVVALEVENEDGSMTYVTSERQMAKLGFSALEYREARFFPGREVFDEDEVLF